MKKHQERALNAFAALESLPDSMLLEAEQALIAAEGGVITPVKKPKGGFARIMSSGWTAAAISCIVALGVLIFIVRAGREAPAYQPPVKPAGSTIEMATEGADFTISTEVENYPDGVGSITVVMTGRVKGKTITAMGGWHLERLTPEGAVAETVYYTEEVTISAKPGRDEYATISKTLYGSYTGGGFPAGTYRLHATRFDGEKYVSVAWCTFTIGEPEGETRPILDYPPAEEQLYTVEASDMTYGSGDGVSVKITATEQGASLYEMPPAFAVVKLAGPANGSDTGWDSMELLIPEIKPSAQDGGYAVYRTELELGDGYLPGLYRLYALTSDGSNAYVDYCDFVIYEEGHIPLTTDDPDRIVVPGIFLWANNTPMIVMMDYYDGLYPEPNPAYAAVAVMYPILLVNDHRDGGSGRDLHSGSVVEVEIGKKLTYPHYGDLYALRVVTEGTLNDVDPDWLIFLQEAGYTIRETAEADLPYEVSLTRTMYAEGFTTLSVTLKAYEAGVGIGGGNQWALYRVEGSRRTLIGSRSTEEAFEPPEVAPDEFCEVSRIVSIPDLTGGETLPAGQYELVYDPNGFAVPLPFEVIALPEDAIEAGVGSVRGYILKEQNSPAVYLLSGSTYPECLMLFYDRTDLGEAFDELNSGDYVELLAWNFIEPALPCATVGMVNKLRDGTLESIPDVYDELLELYGITPAP